MGIHIRVNDKTVLVMYASLVTRSSKTRFPISWKSEPFQSIRDILVDLFESSLNLYFRGAPKAREDHAQLGILSMSSFLFLSFLGSTINPIEYHIMPQNDHHPSTPHVRPRQSQPDAPLNTK